MRELAVLAMLVGAVAAATAGRRYARRQRADLIGILGRLVGQRVELGLASAGRGTFVAPFDVTVGRVKADRLMVFDPQDTIRSAIPAANLVLYSWLTPEAGIPLDRIRWVRAGGERWSF